MLWVVPEAPVISIEMSTSAMWFMVFGIMPLAKCIGMLFVCAQEGLWHLGSGASTAGSWSTEGKVSAMLKLMGILPAGFYRAKVILEVFNFPRPCRLLVILLGMQSDVLDCILAMQQLSPPFSLLRSQVYPCHKASSGMYSLYVLDYFLSSKDCL